MKKTLILFALLLGISYAQAQYTIYPVPQAIEAIDGTCSMGTTASLICDTGIDQATINRATQVLSDHGVTATVSEQAQAGVAVIYLKIDESVAVEGKYDAHTISLTAGEQGQAVLTITGQNTDAVFFGLASVEQMLDASGISQLPCVSISDYADQQQRGIVEGYYGYPYSVEVKKDLMRFMMRMKMNTYLYGAKSDPYHSDYWAKAYPETITAQQEENGWMSQDMIRDVCATSAATKVNFIWAIHPGNNFLGSNTVVSDILGKFEMMYNLGVRQFGVFVDDVSIPSSDSDMELNATRLTQLQRGIEEKWNTEGALPQDTVKPIHFVPQIYCRSFAGSQDQHDRFFTALSKTPQNVVIYTTGYGVWSVPNSSDLATPKEFLGRNVAWWWNYPCNDNADAMLFPMSMYTNFSHMPSVSGSATMPKNLQNGLGIVSNPMQEGEVAKVPLFSVADYAWNNDGFNNLSSWEASFGHILDAEHAQALRTIAPFLTKFDPEGTFSTNINYSTMQGTISELLSAVEKVRELETSEVESDRLMWRDLKCWVLKLNDMLKGADLLIKAKQATDNNEKWTNYASALELVDSLNTKEEFEVYSLEGMGANVPTAHRTALPAQTYLAPYIQSMRNSAISTIFSGNNKAIFVTNTTYSPIVYYTSEVYFSLLNKTFAPGEYAGISLKEPTAMSEVVVADNLLQKMEVMYSCDGQNWETFAPNGSNTKPVEGKVKYLVATNVSGADVKVSFSKSNFRLVPESEPTVVSLTSPAGNDYNDRKYAYDGDYTTWWCVNQNQVSGDKYVLELSKTAPLKSVRLGIGTTNSDYMNTGRLEVSADNVRWTTLRTMGTNYATFSIKTMQEYSSECKVLDFNGKDMQIKYIRFTNVSANTSKWLRIFDIQPFFNLSDIPAPQAEEICDGDPSTYVVIAKGDTINYALNELANVDGVDLYTNKGIITIYPETSVCNLPIAFDEDMKVYEVIVNTGSCPEEITAISATMLKDGAQTTTDAGPIYDLQGRPLPNAPQKGIYLRGGKVYRQ